ncbi:TIGR00730 family Rossman fold protein [Corynebacterium sp. MSK008]|uniref:TIGR00730 family Rossman fold protein n=1 Tax=Corynebacterium sp. MSK008 TaxID=3050188 RepID=UPI00255026F1|nr:TIGR00730 family Rossman fold protein [Corynebacterium sp. MSK008]MDK8880465.1 TIGR00730 family Rossman fold protein [Corynebacterium sp. MSK008]
MNSPVMISVAAIVFTDEQGRVLCVRKHTSPRFQLPGGKPEPGETLVETALRETREEVGLDVDPEDLSYLGQFRAPASNEPGCTVTSTVFLHPGTGLSPAPAAEIAEARWIDPTAPDAELAPLLRGEIFPALKSREIEAIAVYAGAREGTNPANAALARAFGEALADADITLVYGGSKLGLMGEVAAGSSRSIGVLTEHLVNYELQYEGLERLEVVTTMSERKARMSELADAIVALPGGAGTLDELFEEWTSQQLGLHHKPIGLLGSEFWAPLVAMIDHMVEQGFMRRTDRAHMVVADDPQELLAKLRAWAPPVPRWL